MRHSVCTKEYVRNCSHCHTPLNKLKFTQVHMPSALGASAQHRYINYMQVMNNAVIFLIGKDPNTNKRRITRYIILEYNLNITILVANQDI